jgi:hypothetical protein
MADPITPEAALDQATQWAEFAAAADAEMSPATRASIAQAWAMVSLAASNLVPDPNQVYADARADLEAEVHVGTAEAITKLVTVEGILDRASRADTRRHPAIVAALQAIRTP